MLLNLPMPVIITLNIIGWPVIHLTLGSLATRWSRQTVDRLGTLLPLLPGETIRRYDRWLRIRRWKNALPDAADWFHGGITKSAVIHSPAFREQLRLETLRSEAAHWLMLLAAGIFLLWNPLWAAVVMVTVALLLNMPCILVQRYNRLRAMRRL